MTGTDEARPLPEPGTALWHSGEMAWVLPAGKLRDELWQITCLAERGPDPYPPRPADQPDSLLALNAYTAVREMRDQLEMDLQDARDGAEAAAERLAQLARSAGIPVDPRMSQILGDIRDGQR